MRKLMMLSILLPALAQAAPSQHEPGHGRFDKPHHPFAEAAEGRLPFFLRGIELTEQQRSQIEGLLKTWHDSVESELAQERTGMHALRALSLSADYSEAKAAALVEQAQARHKALALGKAKLDHDIYQLLSDEQRQKLAANREKGDMGGHGGERCKRD